jgi:hypothetical protein
MEWGSKIQSGISKATQFLYLALKEEWDEACIPSHSKKVLKLALILPLMDLHFLSSPTRTELSYANQPTSVL